jgi:hypothetical protein
MQNNDNTSLGLPLVHVSWNCLLVTLNIWLYKFTIIMCMRTLSPVTGCGYTRGWTTPSRLSDTIHNLSHLHSISGDRLLISSFNGTKAEKIQIQKCIIKIYIKRNSTKTTRSLVPVSLICYELSLWFQSGLYVFRLRYLNIFLLYLVKPFLQYRTIQGTYNLYQDFKWFCSFWADSVYNTHRVSPYLVLCWWLSYIN